VAIHVERGAQTSNAIPAKRTRVRFTARVEGVRPLSEVGGTAKAVHADPRFALLLRVAKVAPEGSGIAAGSQETLLIHSVAKLFTGAEASAVEESTFDFSVERIETAEGVRWADLRVER